MLGLENVVSEIRAKVPAGFAVGNIIIDGEFVTNGGAGETLYGNYHVKFELNEEDEIEFGEIQFFYSDGKYEVIDSADALLTSGFNWWIQYAEAA